jgi:pheromone shutdown protein TraB
LSSLGVLIAGGHPITIASAFLAAPLTSLNPTIGAGMVVGIVEAWIRKPTIHDFRLVRKDVVSLKGWRKNKVARTMLVFVLGTLGSALGTYVAGFRIFGQLVG